MLAFELTTATTLLLSLLTTTGGVLANPIAQPGDTISSCAVILCPANHECVVTNGKAGCVPIGGSEQCGPNVCASGLKCCNASCGICTKPGQACTMQACLGPQCGKNAVCAFGEKCCNPSCGYCVKPGQQCTMEACLSTN